MRLTAVPLIKQALFKKVRLRANTLYYTFHERNFVMKRNQHGRKSLSAQIGALNCPLQVCKSRNKTHHKS